MAQHCLGDCLRPLPVKLPLILSGVCSLSSANYFPNPFGISVNVLIFIGSTAGRCLISLKDSVQREEEKRLLQLLLFSVSQASTTMHRQLKNTEAFTVNLPVVSSSKTEYM